MKKLYNKPEIKVVDVLPEYILRNSGDKVGTDGDDYDPNNPNVDIDQG